MKRSSSAFAFTLVLVSSCSEKTERPVPRAPTTAVVVAPAPAPAAAADAGIASDEGSTTLDGAPTELAFLKDGSLAIIADHAVIVVDGAGKIHRKPIQKLRATLSSTGIVEGIVLDDDTQVALLETPSLRELYAGPGYRLSSSPGAIATTGSAPSVMLQIGGKLARFALPAGKPKRVASVDVVANGATALVSWSLDDTMDSEARLFDVATGRMLGRALPVDSPMLPISAIAGGLQYGIDGDKLVVIDLATSAVVRSAKVACPKGSFLGNPLPAPGGDIVLVTCGDDGIALDAKTLAPKRRFNKIIPGCDNGQYLGGRFDDTARSELVLEGCGGEARLDVRTGKYRCSDDIGLVGAPYDVLATGGTTRRAPAGRENLPRCTKQDETAGATMPLGESRKYAWVYGDVPSIAHPGGKIVLEADASGAVLSADESKVAYLGKGGVVVRSLPDGKVLRELAAR